VRKPEGKRPLRIPKRSWENNNKIGLSEIRWDGMEWVYLAQDRYQWRALVKTAMNNSGPTKCWEILEWLSD
jgi:hypothetical protein